MQIDNGNSCIMGEKLASLSSAVEGGAMLTSSAHDYIRERDMTARCVQKSVIVNILRTEFSSSAASQVRHTLQSLITPGSRVPTFH